MSSSASDPIRSLQRWKLLLWSVATPILLGVVAWAVSPLDVLSISADDTEVPAPSSDKEQTTPEVPIDPQVFAVNLWNAPAQPVSAAIAEAPERPQKPLNLQLIGIIEEANGVRKAAVYDPDSDRMHIVASGDTVDRQTIRAILANGIELTDGQSTRRLILKQEPS